MSSNSVRILLGAASAAALAAAIEGGADGFVSNLQQSLLGVGGPTALGILGVQSVKGDKQLDMADILLVGVTGVGIVMLVGAIPFELDGGTIFLGLTMSAGAYLGNYLAGNL